MRDHRSTRVWSLMTGDGAREDAWIAHVYRVARATGARPWYALMQARRRVPCLRERMGVRPSDRLPACSSFGGYSIVYWTRRGDCLCPSCATTALDRVDGGDGHEDPPIIGDAYWEGPPMQCEECGTDIESSYGDPNEGES